jgi:YD repeat-containing protein
MVTHGSTEIHVVTYQRDLLGRIISKQETTAGTVQQTSYRYDEPGRLVSTTVDGTTIDYD